MLEYIRSNAQSFGVKLAFGVIILVFVFWGVGSLSERGGGNHVAMVNGTPITARDFELAYRHAEEAMQRENPGMARDQLVQQQLGRQVLRDLVTQSLLSQEAARAGIVVTPLELRLAVGRVKAFQNVQGQFDPAAYKRVLDAQRISPAQYEHDMREDLLRQKIFALVTASAWTDSAETRNRYNFLREQRVVEYAFIPASDHLSKAQPAEAEAAAYYDAHKADFATPAKVNVAYIMVRPEVLGKADSISEADARQWYEANVARFTGEEQVKAAHILVPLAEDAPEAEVKKAQETVAGIESELKGGKSFAAVADAHNGPNAAGPGGQLGWIRRGMTVPAFEEAAFALAPGKVSAPVRSQFGLHVIKVEDKKAGGTQPFKDVADEARKGMARERGEARLHDVLDSLIEDNILGKPLADSAKALGLEAGETGLASAAQLEQKLGIKAEAAASLVSIAAGAPMDTALEAGNAYVVTRVLKSEPASTEALSAVKDKIVGILKAEQALAQALSTAGERRKTLADGPLNPTLKASLGLHTAKSVERGGQLADFAPDQALTEAVFNARPGTWLPTAYAVTSQKTGPGAVLVYVSAVQSPDPAEWDMVKDVMATAVSRERAEGLFEIFMQRLLSGARVEVLNQAQVDRKSI